MEGEPKIIGIAGASGSGKTTFAKQLQQALAMPAVVISHDDYYKHLPHMTKEEAAAYDFDCPEALDTHLLVQDLRTLKSGKSVAVPQYDFATYSRTEEARIVDPAPAILVEGLFIMCDPELMSMFDLVVFIDADNETSLARRIERDCRERNIDPERAMKMYHEKAKPAYERYVEPLKNRAGIIINDTGDVRALNLAKGFCETLVRLGNA